jgi:hypothetical protein
VIDPTISSRPARTPGASAPTGRRCRRGSSRPGRNS